ncbi:hypothetical protein BCV70DRAFT_199611 [Testicularia cyperi]|uniref:Mur ligase central domain-containing protein n=1 Tax=Testicularia cyperi TaxID=1882483 RepID=A0A317XSG4_9BASI|nr:hypothetical protein BCV70DRAFT_199611 [Testicularia cyperi]
MTASSGFESPALPGGGPAPLIVLKTHPPLPSFCIPYRLPDPSSEISSFKLAILRILTGQTNSHSSTKPLTFSEELKEKTINGWKMEMLTLELRQHDDLPSLEEEQQEEQQRQQRQEQQQTGDALAEDSTTEMPGFELQDHHECSLIEEGDHIVVRLRAGHSLKDLELPDLGSNHRYSAPAGSLTRAGTLSQPPPYSIIQPSEPSSFSSSVGAQPNANYHQHRYQDTRQGFRVVTAANVGSGHIRRASAQGPVSSTNPAPLGRGLNLVQPSKPKRRASASATPRVLTNTSTTLTSTYNLTTAASSPKNSTPNASTAALPASTVDQQNVSSPPTSPTLASHQATPAPAAAVPNNSRKHSSSALTLQQQQQQSDLHSNGVATGGSGAASASASPNPNGRSSGQFAGMPSTALVIGPGVQGQVGRNPNSAAAPIGSLGGPDIQSDEFGNAKGFVGFTSAGSDVRMKTRRKISRVHSQEFSGPTESGISNSLAANNVLDASTSARRRPSNPATAAADAAERRAALARQDLQQEKENDAAKDRDPSALAPQNKRPARTRQVSSESNNNGARPSRSDPAHPPVLPPIQNPAPFPEISSPSRERRERDLPPMPMPASDEALDPSAPSSSMVAVSTPTETRPPRLSFLRKFSSATQRSGTHTNASASDSQGGSTPGLESQTRGLGVTSTPLASEDYDPAIQPGGGEASQNSSLSRAERRYMEVQKALALERERQADAEKTRAEGIRASQQRKQKERERKEFEARKRVEDSKWEIWEEVRRRQKAEATSTTPVPPAIQRLYSESTNASSVDPSSAGLSAAEVPQAHAQPSPRSAASGIATKSGNTATKTLAESSTSASATVTNKTSGGAGGLAASADSRPGAGAVGGNSFNSTGPRIELGLERIAKLLDRLGSPQKRFPVIHVAGTNGKGSTIAYLDAILRNALDIRTGTFVSPHLIERRDCCKVDGEVIAKDVWRQAQSDVLFADQGLDVAPTKADDGQPLKSSPFELLTAQTFQAFSLLPASSRPEVLLIEVGLGGRLDATNVFDDQQVLASLVCPIDRDHEAFLGSQLEGIAREKAGIVKDTGLCIIADQRIDDSGHVDQLALGPLENEARQLGARAAGILDSVRNVCMSKNARLVKTYIPWKLLSLPRTRQERWGSQIDFTPRLAPTLFLSTSGLNPPSTFVAHPHDPVMFSVPVSVERTRANLTGVCMALQTLSSIARDEWAQDRWEDLRTRIMWGLRDDPEANLRVREAIHAVRWQGRCSWHHIAGVPILVDGAHNEASAMALREYIDNCLATRALSHASTGTGDKSKGKSRDSTAAQATLSTQFEVNYIFAFSDGKDYSAMVKALLANPTSTVMRQNVALTTFSPPEGMPWVKSVPAQEALAVVKEMANHIDIGEIRVLGSISDAVEWASRLHSAAAKGQHGGPTVIAGSLYLVADMYRYLQSQGLHP